MEAGVFNVQKVFVYSDEFIKACDENPAVKGRASIVFSLIASYPNILRNFKMAAPKKASVEDLRLFHTLDYIDCLKKCADESDEVTQDDCDFGLAFDCAKWPGVFEYALFVAGGTICAANEILNGAKVVINWCGGWHHSHSDQAGGYCYINDIVLGILRLRQKFDRILYVDLDNHHGDGVENAFSITKKVFTLSFHCGEPGFFPGTGLKTNDGFGPGKGYSANFPYKFGCSGENFKKFVCRTFQLVYDKYKPQVILVQCGADILPGDPLGAANVLPEDVGFCLKEILEKPEPLMLLGGGGYNIPNSSRYWTYLTAVVCGEKLEDDIPENDFFLDYGPGFELAIRPSNIKDCNSVEYLEDLYKSIENNLNKTFS